MAGLYEHDERSMDAVDFSLVHADDAFLDALGSAAPGAIEPLGDNRLAELLLSWRQDVDAEPIPEPVDDKLAVVTVHAARMRRHRIHRLLIPLSVAVASVAIVFAWVGLAAQDARPGDTLWGLMKVLYADRARSVEAAVAVDTSLREAEEALAKGQLDEAKSKLDKVRSALPTVSSEDGQADLRARTDELLALLPGNPFGGVAPPPEATPSTAASIPATDAEISVPQAPVPTAQPTPPPTTTTTGQLPPPVTTSTQPSPTETTQGPNTEPNAPKAVPNTKASKGHVPTGSSG